MTIKLCKLRIICFAVLGMCWYYGQNYAKAVVSTEPATANVIKEPINKKSIAVQEAIKTRPSFPDKPYLEWYSSTVLVDQQVAPGVYFAFDINAGERNAKGQHNMPTSLYIIGEKEVLVVETQTTERLAKELMALIREKTDLPIKYIVNSTSQGDHHFGNMFFPEDAKVIQHEETFKLITNPVEFEKNKKIIGLMAWKEDLENIKARPADILVAKDSTVKVNLGNRIVEVIHFGKMQSKGDLMVWLPKEKMMFTGNIVYSAYPTAGIIWLLEGDLDTCIRSYKKFQSFIPKDAIILPGHGVPTTVKMVDLVGNYLQDLKKELTAARRAKLTLEEAKKTIIPKMKAKYGNFTGYEMVQKLNITKCYSGAK